VRLPASIAVESFARDLPDAGSVLLPPGSRLVLAANPLALSSTGEIVPVPLFVLVETREAGAPGATVRTLDELRYDVLEGRRAFLTASPRPGGGLERLAADTPTPLGATCSPTPSNQVPLRSVCATCHGTDGARLTGPMRHGKVAFEIESDPSAAARTVARDKARDPAFTELRELYDRD
jgi:cytochrome c553